MAFDDANLDGNDESDIEISEMILNLTPEAGEVGYETPVYSFAEKLKENKMPNAVTVEVRIDGQLFLGGFEFPETDTDIEVLVKIRHEESKTSMTSLEENDDSTAGGHDDSEKKEDSILVEGVRSTESVFGSSQKSEKRYTGIPIFDFKRLEDLGGTFIPAGAKTLVSRGVQTGKNGARWLSKIPARFEGNMLVPMYFEGLMITPDFFYQVLEEAAEKRGKQTIPVLFKSGTLATAFKKRLKNFDTKTDFSKQVEQVRVKFEGRLKDILDQSYLTDGIPVLLNGKLIF